MNHHISYKAALLKGANAELGSGGYDQHISRAINGGDLEAKDSVRYEWVVVTRIYMCV